MLTGILKLELIMAMLIAVGIVLKSRGKITEEGRECLTNIVVDVIIPCSIVKSFIGQGDAKTLLASLPIIGLSVLIMVMCSVLGKLCFRRLGPQARTLAEYGLINSNCMFIGLPVVVSLLGDEGGLLQSLYMIFVRCYIWSYGMSLFTGKGANLRETVKKATTNPAMIAAMIGIVLMLTGIQMPEVLDRTMGYFSDCLMAMSMVLIGTVLCGMDLRHIFRADVWWYNFIRLIVAPGLALGICLILHTSYMITAVAVVLAAMPSASLTAVFAARYHYDLEYGSLIVATSTVVSILTIPLWFLAVNAVFGM